MKNKLGIKGKILCFALVLFIAIQTASLTVAGAGAGLVSPSGVDKKQDSPLPDVGNDDWEIPTAQENPNKVDLTINNGIVYNDHVYAKLQKWDYIGNYQRFTDPYTGYWRDFTASLGPIVGLTNYRWSFGKNGNWIQNPYITTAVKRHNGDYGIHKNLVTPTLEFGGRLNIVLGYISVDDVQVMASASRANIEQASMRVSAWGGPGTSISYCGSESGNTASIYTYTPNAATDIVAEINLMQYYKEERPKDYPAVKFNVENGSYVMGGINVAFIDNTSPSIQSVDVSQEGDNLVVKLKTNEGVRWSSSMVEGDLNDMWIEVDLQVSGTEHVQTVRAHISGIDYRYKFDRFEPDKSDFSNEIVFKGDLGVFAGLDYKVLDISGISMPKKDYPITFGTVSMIANQTKDNRIRNQTLGKWDSVNKVTVYETYNTTAICDIAGNPINLESVVNWPINQKEIKNNEVFVRKIELMNDKILMGKDMSKADGFMEDISRAEYFFGPDDEIAPRLFLNKILSDEEVKTFKLKTSVKDDKGEFIWLEAASTGKYTLGIEEFMYIDFEPLTLTRNMVPYFQEGNKGYFEVLEVECELDESHPFTDSLPAAERTLYIDMSAPVVSASSLSLEEPDAKDGYYKLDVEIHIKDEMVDSTLQAGVLGQGAYFKISADVNESTPIKFLVDTNATPPSTVEGYTGEGKLVPGGTIKLGDRAIGMTSDDINKAYVHLLIPEKADLLVKGVKIYVEVSDTVGNEANAECDIEFRIDKQKPEISFTSSSTVFTSDSAITTVKVEATDHNNVESVSYQWVEAGQAYDDSAWESAIVDSSSRVSATITEQFKGTGSVSYDMMLYVKCRDDRGNESIIIQRNEKISIEKPVTSFDAKSDITVPSTHPEITVTGPEKSTAGKTGYTRVTISPLNPRGDWTYVTVVESGKEIDLFTLDTAQGNKWYKATSSGALYTSVAEVDGETVTFDSLRKYYGNLKISFENAYMDLTPVLGYFDETVTDGSYIADQNYITVRFASQDSEITSVNTVNFGKVTDRDGEIVSEDGDSGAKSIYFGTSLRGVNGMRGATFYFDINNIRMNDWGLLDVDFASSKIELLRSDKKVTDEVIYTQIGLAKSGEQYFAIPAYKENGDWFETGVYKIRVTVKSFSGSDDVAESLNIVYDAGIPENDGLVSYSHDLRYETGAYRTQYSGDPVDSFGIAIQPGMEAHRNNVFAVYTGGVTGFSFTIGADDTTEVYDGYTVGAIEGFRYWNSLSSPTEEDLAGYEFRRYQSPDGSYTPSIIVTSGVSSIYTEETIPKGADGLGDIYLVEGVNVICYQVKMANGYVSPVKQFTIIVTQYIPEFNVIVEDYTPSYEAAQRDGQVNAHDITVKIEEAFSLNGSGNVNVEIWSSYAMEVNGEWVAESEEGSSTSSLTCLADGLKAGDTAVLTENSYTTCFPPYDGQGNYCTAAFAAIDEYGGMVVFAPQIGPLSRVYDSSNPVSDNYAIEYYGDPQDDPFTIGYDTSFIMIYNQPIFFGEELVGFENLMSRAWGPYEQVETSISQLEYNLFAIDSNSVEFSPNDTSWAGNRKTTSAIWNASEDIWTEAESKVKNYTLIDWDNTTITFYDGDGNVLAEGLSGKNPGPNAAGFIGYSYGGVHEPEWNGSEERRYMQLSLNFANPMATEEHPAYDWDKNSSDVENENSKMPISFKITGINILGDRFETDGYLELRYIDYSSAKPTMTGSGIVLNLPFVTQDRTETVYTGLFNGAGKDYSLTVTDAYGVEHTVEGRYGDDLNFDIGTSISFSNLEKTSKPVEITISRNDGKKVYVDVTDAEIIMAEGNGTYEVKLTVTEPVRFTYKYLDDESNEVSKTLEVNNIVKPDPRISVDVDTSNVLVDEDGTVYRYGNVVVTLVDDNFTLTDIYTGETPKFTFTPGGVTSYVFSKDEIVASLENGETTEIPKSLNYSIGFELREVIDPLAELTVADAPSVKINAFKEDRGYYDDAGLALILEPTGVSDSIVEKDGDTVMKYSGNRVNASAFLSRLGWGSSYRFLAEVTFGGAYKTFIKQGIYTQAPDYESGKSDAVDGVTLNGRLITVEKNTQFTFFVVAKNGNYTSVVFDVEDIGSAPAPKIVKVPIGDKTVKVYILEPDADGVTDFTVTPADVGIKINTDAFGDYAGVPYVEYDKNDDYIINYSFTYGGEKVTGQLDTSIYEIKAREMKQNGTISWSANKTLEATDKDVSATLSFSETVIGVEVTDGEIDASKVQISSSGRQVTVKFLDNHAGFTIKVKSSYGDVVITLDGVDNIDREPPAVKEIAREITADGKRVKITLATSEMTVFREGGYIGEKTRDKDGKEIYLYTREITENGSYTYHFTDMSGIETSITVVISEIVTDELGVFFSTDKNKDGALTDPSSFILKAGDKVYVLATRDATVYYNGGDGVKVKGDEWLEITLDDGVGGASPYVTVTDSYGSVVIRQFSQIIPNDTEAPIVTVQKSVITVRAGSDRTEIEKLLLANVFATDKDESLTYSVEFTDDVSTAGSFTATYTVKDSAGNEARAECRLRIVSGAEPDVSINGTQIDREATYYAESGEKLTLTVFVEGQPYCVYYESGIKTVAQMKIGSTDLTDGYVKDATVEIGALESGYYTLIVQTQSRDYFRIIIYVY